jgi:(S)-ureidoglycine-glyoxylate aminotransferase
MLYAARECARLTLQEGLAPRIARHRLAGAAMASGLAALGLELYGESAHRMTHIVGVIAPAGIDYDRVRHRMRTDFQIEIGAAFGALMGKMWRIGTMGLNARRDAVFATLAALETILRQEGFRFPAGAGLDAAFAVYERDASGHG